MPNQNPSAHPKYRPDIDGLRAIAVLSVLGFHAFGVMGGFVGVDIFFVISGFLISTIIFEGLDKKTFSFNEFYQRRIRRIFPSLLLVFIACLIFGWFVLFADEYEQLGKHVLSGAGFVSNLVLWSESGYFDTAAEKKILLHLWSLGIEEQFYFVWPIFGYLLWKFRAHFSWIILAIAGFSFGLNVWLVGTDSVTTFYFPLTRFWELLAGAYLAHVTLFHRSQLIFIKRNANWFSLAGLVLIAISISLLTKDFAFPGWWALLPVSGASLLIITGPETWVSTKVLSNRILVWFGLISFPLYLWHWPLLTFVKLLDEQSKHLKLIAVALSILLAWLSYKYLETPIRHGKYLTAKSFILLGAMLAVAISGLAVYQSAGFEFRINDGQGGQLAKKYKAQLEWPESYNHSEACRAKYKIDFYCMIDDVNKPPTAAIIGDSHASHFYPGLADAYKKNDGNLLLLGWAGCPPFIGIDWSSKSQSPKTNCYKKTAGLYEEILEDKNIKTVFIAFHHDLPFFDDLIYEDKMQELKFENNYQAAVDSLTRTIRLLEENNKRVILIYDLPDLNKDIKNCAFERPHRIQKAKCTLGQESLVNNFQVYDKMIAAVQRTTKVEVFDTRPYINENFPVDSEGNLMYRDSTHLSYKGSLYFSDKYLK